jgi:hypothetical protein
MFVQWIFGNFALNVRSEFGHWVELGGSEGGSWLHRQRQPCLNIKATSSDQVVEVRLFRITHFLVEVLGY